MIEVEPIKVGELEPDTDPQFLTPDGLYSDIMVVDDMGNEVAYVSPETRAYLNRMNAEDGLPLVAAIQPGTEHLTR